MNKSLSLVLTIIHIVMKDIATLDAAVDLVSKLEACEHAVGYNASFYRYNMVSGDKNQVKFANCAT